MRAWKSIKEQWMKKLLFLILVLFLLALPMAFSFSATGGVITTAGGYTIHTFRSSGTFTPDGTGNIDYLIVAGGGGGGVNGGGGGGAGGFRNATDFEVTAQAYTITIGAGGASHTAGGDSNFSLIDAKGGGHGASYAEAGDNGGSGGGGGADGTTTRAGGTGTAGQGYDGGDCLNTETTNTAAGGGGASKVGYDNAGGLSGNGGDGLNTSINGTSETYAGGGGGGGYAPGSATAGSGGAGGGGDGKDGAGATGEAGTPNTGGGGGGGAGASGAGGAGGSGIVIIRYPVAGTFTLTAIDAYDSSTINNFTVTITNSTFSITNSTTEGSLGYDNLGGLMDINLTNINDSGGYFNKSYVSVNVSSNFEAALYQAIIYVNVSEVITGNKITSFTAAAPLQSNSSNSTGWSRLLLKAGRYNISANATGYLTGWNEINILALSEDYATITLGTANLTITANSIISGAAINTFTINLTHLALNYEESNSTTTGNIVFKTIASTYNLSINAAGYAISSQILTIHAGDTLPNVTFSLYSQNSINITIYDEETQKIINYTTTTLVFDHNLSKETLSTTNGTLYKDDLNEGLWDIAASTPIHYLRHYFITITSQSHNTLDIWLLNSSVGSLITFTIKDQQDAPLENVFVTVTNKVNDSYVTVAQKYSDFAGQAVFLLKTTTTYRLMLEADGYTTKTFNLEPSSSAYNIIMTSVDTIPFTTIYDKVSYVILPNTTIITNTNLSFIVSSVLGYISYFGLNTTTGNIKYKTNISGSVGGGTASLILPAFNITESISVDHFIKLSDEDLIVIHKTYYRTNITRGNQSAMSIADKYKDDFTGVMKAVIVVFLVIAIIATFAELGVPATISGVIGVLLLIPFAIFGWIPKLMVFIIAIIVVGMFLIGRGD